MAGYRLSLEKSSRILEVAKLNLIDSNQFSNPELEGSCFSKSVMTCEKSHLVIGSEKQDRTSGWVERGPTSPPEVKPRCIKNSKFYRLKSHQNQALYTCPKVKNNTIIAVKTYPQAL